MTNKAEAVLLVMLGTVIVLGTAACSYMLLTGPR